jgi:hypothetical protein
MMGVFSQKFVLDTYKKHREDVLLSREQALLPATQPIAELQLKIRNRDRDLKQLTQNKEAIRGELMEARRLYTQTFSDEDREKYHNVYMRVEEIEFEIDIRTIQFAIPETVKRNVERREFIHKCSREDCKGFLSQQYKCGICEYYTCTECLEIKGLHRDDPHTCNPTNVETAKLIKNDTKPCPSCGTRIFKISGCSQMFCTNCHKAFDWNTGRIETGVIHNPHYFDYIRRARGEREAGGARELNVCGGLPSWGNILRVGRKYGPIKKIVEDCYNNHNHIAVIELARYNVPNYGNRSNEDLRVKYLLNDIDEKKFKTQLQIREKKREKNTEFANVIQTLRDVTLDIFARLMQVKNKKEFDEVVSEFSHIREYVNLQFVRISKTYKCKKINLSENWGLVKVK